ncbi:MAG: hypothetical protein AAF429_09225 [Pseudomonadota bacterium]
MNIHFTKDMLDHLYTCFDEHKDDDGIVTVEITDIAYFVASANGRKTSIGLAKFAEANDKKIEPKQA